jgi:hypothetical protein
VDIFGAEYFPPQYTVQSRLNGLGGVARSLDLILRVSITILLATWGWAGTDAWFGLQLMSKRLLLMV